MRDSDRDRSPARSADRRPSVNYASRLSDESASSLNREPPRGPKAMEPTRSHFSSTPRARPFSSRPEYRDRDRDRDYRSREPSSLIRRPDDQRLDWTRRDRETGGRDGRSFSSRRSRSPPAKDRWDTRLSPTASADPSRLRRESKESLPPFTSRAQDVSTWTSRGGPVIAGRGRTDYDRGRPRGSAVESDQYRTRSRSREAWRDRDAREDRDRRDADHDRNQRPERRDFDKWHDREDRDRDAFLTKRDRPPSRNSVSSSTVTTPSTAQPAASMPGEKASSKTLGETGRRYSISTPSGPRRDMDKADYFSLKTENTSRNQVSRAISPAPPPQVPAFGAPLDFSSGTRKVPPTQQPELVKSTQFPTGPKIATALSNQTPSAQPPTAPKAIRESMYNVSPRESKFTVSDPRIKDLHLSTSRPAQSNGPVVSRPVPAAPTGPRAASQLNRPGSRAASDNVITANAQSPHSRPSFLDINSRHTTHDSMQGPASTIHKPTSMQWVNPAYQQNLNTSRVGTHPSLSTAIKENIAAGDPTDSSTPSSAAQPNEKDTHDEEAPGEVTGNQAQKDLSSRVLSPKLLETNPLEQIGTKSSSPSLSTEHHSSEDDADEDEEMGLDEEDLAASESKYQRDREALLSRRPPLPLNDPQIVEKLVKMQLLEIIISEKLPDEIGKLNVESSDVAFGVPKTSPPLESKETDRCLMPPGRPLRLLKNPPQNAMLTPPLENLPYLDKNTSTSGITLEAFEAILSDEEELSEGLWHRIHELKQEDLSNGDDLRNQFSAMYRPWRSHVSELDRKKREENPMTPRPASPTPSEKPTTVATPMIGTRGAKNLTELDFQNVLKASAEWHREEQERKERSQNAKADPEKEAAIPPMLDTCEQDADVFEDSNQLVTADDVLDVYDFVPLQDDFSEDEQKAFLQAYLTWPKKWGKIAEYLPDRDFQQCILHYYLTKQAEKYKEAVKKSLGKRGRRTRGPATRPKSNALMADLGVRPDVYEGDEFEATLPAVTDTGRPRRAAAPTFGDNGPDSETLSGGPTRPRGGTNKDLVGDQSSEKPGRGGKRTRGTRRPKGQQMQVTANIGPSPQKIGSEVGPITKPVRGMHKTESGLLKVVENQTLDPQRQGDNEVERHAQFSLTPSASENETVSTGFQVYQQPHQPSSYWSVFEVRDFPNLLKYYGRNFEAISAHMRTKTTIMVKNYFVRSVENGKSEFEKLVEEAEARKQRGDPMGPPPVQAAPPKRRYDLNSNAANQRPLAPSTETSDIEDATNTAVKPTVFDRSPPTISQGSPSFDHPMSVRVPSMIQPPTSQMTSGPIRAEESMQANRSTSSGQSRPSQGPKIGLFNDDIREVRQTSSAAQMVPQQHAPMHLHPSQPQEKGRSDQARHQTILPQRQNIAPQPAQQASIQFQQGASAMNQSSYMPPSTMSPHQASGGGVHARHSSSASSTVAPAPSAKVEPDNPFPRRQEPPLSIRPYGPSPIQSPIGPRPQNALAMQKEIPRPSSNPPPAQEAPKATPAKRSNIMSILNDEPEEPPQSSKRVSTEQSSTMRLVSMKSPPPTMYSQNPSQIQSSQIYSRRDEAPAIHMQPNPQHRSSFSAQSGQGQMHPPSTLPPHQSQPFPELQSGGWAGDPAPAPSTVNRNWINRFDPRMAPHHTPPSGTPDPTGRGQQLPMSPYAAGATTVQPPATTVNSASIQPVSSSHYHRMALQQPVPANPSPPPASQTPQPVGAPYRTHSSTAQHNRMPSYGTQPALHVHTTANIPPGHPHSAPSSAIPSLHRQSSSHFESRPMPGGPPPGYGNHQAPTQQQPQMPLQMQHSVNSQPSQSQSQQSGLQIGNGYPSQPARIYTPPAPSYPMYTQQGQYRHYGQSGEERR